MSLPANCRGDCGRRLTPKGTPCGEGTAPHGYRGLCHACSSRHRRAGTLHLFEPLNGRDGRPGRPIRRHLAEDFDFIAQHDGTRAPTAIGWDVRTRQNAAARLGVTPAALDGALYRALRRAG